MIIDRPQVSEGSVIVNATVASGTAFPANPNEGELFYLTTGGVGLYFYNGAWTLVAQAQVLASHLADDARHLTASQNTLLDGTTVVAADLNSIPAVTTRVTNTENNLSTHIADDTKHLTAAQNTLIDGLAGTLTAAELNFVDGVTSSIQAQLNAIVGVNNQQTTDISNLSSSSSGATSGVQTDLNTHKADDTRHLTASQNTLLDGLAGTLVAAELNFVDGVTAPIQPALDVHTANIAKVFPAALYSQNVASTSGLTFAFFGGHFNDNIVANNNLSLAVNDINYVVANRANGAVTAAVTQTNWNDTRFYLRLYIVTTNATTITSIEDFRQAYGFGSFVSPLTGVGDLIIGGTLGAPTRLAASTNGYVLTLAGGIPTWAAASGGGGGGAVRNTVTALSIVAGVVNIDCSLGDYFSLALTENVTSITFSNLPGSGKGASLMVYITQDATPRTVSWPASFKWTGGVPGTVSTGSGVKDTLAITTFDNGVAWPATLAKGLS